MWRRAVQEDLAVVFAPCEVLPGRRSGVSRDLNRLCVFFPGITETAGRVVVGEARVHIRYWPARAVLNGDEAPADPEPLEQAVTDLTAFLQTKQTAYPSTGVWFSRMLSCEIDDDPNEWGVEAVVLLQFDNPAVIA